eukprot:12081140-Heterocapsa_arctica.AAC.1
MRERAQLVLEPQTIASKEYIWANFPRDMDLEKMPTWLTLGGSGNLDQWQEILENVLHLDTYAVDALLRLAQLGDKGYGYQEA